MTKKHPPNAGNSSSTELSKGIVATEAKVTAEIATKNDAVKVPDAKPPKKADSKPKAKRSVFPGFIALLALGVAAGSAYFCYELYQQKEANTEKLALRNNQLQDQFDISLQQVNSEVLKAKKTVEQSLGSSRSESSRLKAQVNSLESQLHELEAQVKKLERRSKQPEKLTGTAIEDRIAYALDIASKRLDFERDINTSSELIGQLIEQYCNPPKPLSIGPVCLGLERDRTALKNVRLPNLNRIVQDINQSQTELKGLLGKLDSLRKKHASKEAPDQQATSSSEIESAEPQQPILNSNDDMASINNWQDRANMALNRLTGFLKEHVVSIHKLEEADSKVLATDQRLFLINDLIILLEQSKTSALRHDQALFKQTIESVQHSIQQYLTQFKLEQTLSRLDSLKAITLKPELPSLRHSYQALNERLKSSSITIQKREEVTQK